MALRRARNDGERVSGVVKRVVVMGGGTSGWMSACYIERLLAHMQLADASVTLVESEDIGIIVVGEATLNERQPVRRARRNAEP